MKTRSLVLFLCVFYKFQSGFLCILDDQYMYANIGTCASVLLKDFHTARMVYFQGAHLDVASSAFRANSSLVKINLYEAELLEKVFLSLHHYSFYVFEIPPGREFLVRFEETLMHLQESPYFNGSARTLVMYLGNETVDAVFEILWKVRLVNSVVIDARADVYSYSPIREGRCGISPGRLIANCAGDLNASFFAESEVLYFPNCSFKTYAIMNLPHIFSSDFGKNDMLGLESKILATIATTLKMELVFLDHNYTFPKLYEAVSARLGDITLGGILLKRDHRPRTISPLFHIYMEMGFFVPYAEIVSPWLNIIHIFDPIVWICIFLSLTIMPLIWRFVAPQRFKLFEYFFYTYQAFITTTTVEVIAKHKLLYLTWIWMAFLILNTYQCTMVSQLFKPRYHKQISTIKELVASKLAIGGFTNFTQLMDAESKDMVNIHSRYGPCTLNGIECMNRSFYQKDFAYFKNARSVIYQLHQLNMSLFLIEPKIVIPSVMVMLKGSPFLARFNVLIRRLQEAGLVDYWDVYKHVQQPERSSEHPPIFLEQLYVVFVIYVVGISVASVQFYFEMRNTMQNR